MKALFPDFICPSIRRSNKKRLKGGLEGEDKVWGRWCEWSEAIRKDWKSGGLHQEDGRESGSVWEKQ